MTLTATFAGCASDPEPIPAGPSVTFATPTSSAAGTTTSLAGAATTVAAADGTSTNATSTAPSTAPSTTGAAQSTVREDPVIALAPVTDAESPVDLAWRRDDGSLYVVEQDGLVRPLRAGALGEPVLDITDLTEAAGERGLLGLAFSPDGSLAYVNYTAEDGGDTHIVEYAVASDGTFDVSSRRELLVIEQPFANHNGGNVMFGPDGFLYIGMGDGGSGGDPQRRATNVTTLLGKVLRIDPASANGEAYRIPADNPFVGVAGARPEIWSVGVRNPWRMSFDRATGDMWFGDVGQGEWEEIDVAWADSGAGRGANFGWSAFEGSHRYNEDQPADGAIAPLFEYEHGDAGCSISGGAVYRGEKVPSLVGWYVYADYCSGVVSAVRAEDKVLAGAVTLAESSRVSAVREGPDGELYVLSLDGPVQQIVAA